MQSDNILLAKLCIKNKNGCIQYNLPTNKIARKNLCTIYVQRFELRLSDRLLFSSCEIFVVDFHVFAVCNYVFQTSIQFC